MRTAVKYRIIFFAIAILGYVFGSKIMPTNLPEVAFTIDALLSGMLFQYSDWVALISATTIFFIVIPACYWSFIIKAGQQSKWRIILVFSLSSLIARYQYPSEIAHYFEFISWLKYPIVAVLLAIELYLMVTVIKALWQARSLSGDPRIHLVKNRVLNATPEDQQSKSEKLEEKKLDLALTFAHEPASWYYAIPRFSRNHPKSIANLNLQSASFLHFILVIIALTGTTILSYWSLSDWSETVAIVVATLIFYGLIMFVANYRISKHYSVYMQDDRLVINNSWWGFLAIDIATIEQVHLGHWQVEKNDELFAFGGNNFNIELTFSKGKTPIYYSAMAGFKETVNTLRLNVDDPVILKEAITEQVANKEPFIQE